MSEIAPIITAVALLLTASGGFYIAIQQRETRAVADKTNKDVREIHVMTNSNLARVERELQRQNQRWDHLIKGLGQHPDAARIFADLVAGAEEEGSA